jgi:transcription-repair coupling factor (superfamily II helicase)
MMDDSLAEKLDEARLFELVDRFERQDGFAAIIDELSAGQAATLEGVWGSACAPTAAAFARHVPETLVVVVAHEDHIDPVIDDLFLFYRETPERFPACETVLGDRVFHDEIFGDRVRLLKQLSKDHRPKLIVTGIQGLMQPVPSTEALAAGTRSIHQGQELDDELFCRWMVERGFHSTTAVELPGEFSRRGGILDIFAPDWTYPVRVELFGDEVESIRRFDVSSQRSLATLESVGVTMLDPNGRHDRFFTDYLGAGSWFYLVEPHDLKEAGTNYLRRLDRPDEVHHPTETLNRVLQFPSVFASGIASGDYETTCQLKIESVEQFTGDHLRMRDELVETSTDQKVILVCPTRAEVQRLGDLFAETPLHDSDRLEFRLGNLSEGFRFVSESILLLSSNQLLARHELRRVVRRRESQAIDSFLDLKENDLVVHVSHGIGRYRGMRLLEKEDQIEEHLELEFADKTKLYVPGSKIGLVQKYVGASRGRVRLSKLGGSTWERKKESIGQAVFDMAADMLELQAARDAKPGIAFPDDSYWQREFDAAFPYRETDDQLTTISAIKEDMKAHGPMDRLICGDVGYGKTEVAMRAAFKAVDAGYQVAMLVPTTVLADQHLRTFSQRMAAFPFQIASLSRFSTKKEQGKTIEALAKGGIDIVIGTHRLAQPDVRFNNLGLVIIDEEQRFGVEIKERLKQLRTTVDILTTTATPIPRTLHMSMLGLRDISNLQTAPEDRLAVETRVTRWQSELIRHAVVRELNRDGQIFFVHNRVRDIEIVKQKLQQIVPEARIRIGHAQMNERDLEQVMMDFVAHKFDLLLATTIVESGLDIPNANTIFIDEADRYGLADLHQLRGRVGRYKHRAYCYLLVDPNKSLTPVATKRLRAIEEFSHMGAGFSIAMRDLEIRGAGNLLGTQQSGHIAAVGYELYCQLLEKAVRMLKRLPPRESVEVEINLPCKAYIPSSYVPDLRAKIDLYRRLARLGDEAALADFREELNDRFGPPPSVLVEMLSIAEVRIAAWRWGIRQIRTEGEYLVFRYTSPDKIKSLAKQTGSRLRIVDNRSAYFPLDKDLDRAKSLLNILKAIL